MDTYFEHRPRRGGGSDLGQWMLALLAVLVLWAKLIVVAVELHH